MAHADPHTENCTLGTCTSSCNNGEYNGVIEFGDQICTSCYSACNVSCSDTCKSGCGGTSYPDGYGVDDACVKANSCSASCNKNNMPGSNCIGCIKGCDTVCVYECTGGCTYIHF